MNDELKKILRYLNKSEITKLLSEVFEIKSPTIEYHLKNKKLYLYTYHQLNIYTFNQQPLNSKELSNNIKLININIKKEYQKYKAQEYNNITLLSSLLYSKNINTKIDIIEKMNISNKEKILTIIKKDT